MSEASTRNGCAATFPIVMGLSMLAPGGLCIVLALPDPKRHRARRAADPAGRAVHIRRRQATARKSGMASFAQNTAP